MSTTSKIRVMVVNDQAEVTQLWEQLINRTPDMTCVARARDGVQAIELATQHCPDVIVMDMHMPVMDGADATRSILYTMPQTRVIIYSAYSGMEERAREAGATEYLLMPISGERLRDIVRHVYYAPA